MKIKNIILAAIACVTLFSCKEDEIDLYSGPNMISVSVLNPDNQNKPAQELVIPFATTAKLLEKELVLEFVISGHRTAIENRIQLSITGDAAEENYTIPNEVVIPANELKAKVNIKITRPSAANAGRKNTLTLRALPNSNLVAGPLDSLVLKFPVK